MLATDCTLHLPPSPPLPSPPLPFPSLPFPCMQVNDIAFHPTHNTLATVGADGKYSFWDKDARTKLKVGGSSPSGLH